MAKTAAALIIGNEILSGRCLDANGPFLARELRELGAEYTTALVVRDQEDAIAEGVRTLAPRVTGLITSGGVGPTHDDITMQAVAEALGRPLRRHPELVALIRELIDPEGRESSLKMADVPEGADLLYGPELRIPVVAVGNVYVLPGLPRLFRRKFLAIRERFRDTPFHCCELYVGKYETEIADLLKAVVARFPEVLLGSYPRPGDESYAVKLTFEGKNPEQVQQALDAVLGELPAEWVIQVER